MLFTIQFDNVNFSVFGLQSVFRKLESSGENSSTKPCVRCAHSVALCRFVPGSILSYGLPFLRSEEKETTVMLSLNDLNEVVKEFPSPVHRLCVCV